MQSLSVNNTAVQPQKVAVPLAADDLQEDTLKAAQLRANKLLRLKQWGDAAAAAQHVLDLDKTSVTGHEILSAAVLQLAQLELYADVVRSATRHCTRLPKFQNIQFQLAAMPAADAQELVAQMYAVWPDEPLVQYFSAQFGSRTSSKSSLKHRSSLPEGSTFDAAAIKLALSGNRDVAIEQLELKASGTNSVAVERAMDVKNIILAMPDSSSYQRPLIVDEGQELVRSEASRNGTTVLYFNSLGLDLIHTFELIDSHFAAAGMASVFLRDHSHNVFVNGLKSIAGGRAATQDYLQETLSDLGTRRLIVVGRSGGGFGALQYGLELGADRIVGFSVPTNMTLDFLRSSADTRGPSLAKRLNETYSRDELQLSDILPRSSAVSEGIHLHYGADMAIDRNHAEHISAAANVHLYPIVGCDAHSTFIHHLAQKNFLELISG